MEHCEVQLRVARAEEHMAGGYGEATAGQAAAGSVEALLCGC
jgi:hypothetical protein